MSKRSVDGSAKDACHVSQVLLPRPEHAVLSRYAGKLGMPFSTFARASMRLAQDPEVRARLVAIFDQIVAEQRGEVAPAFPDLSFNYKGGE
jgi:hypothetical protein